MKMCIVSIIKDETKYLEEWIQYHLKLGIDKIFLFEDIDSISHLEITNKYPQVSLASVLDLYEGKEKNYTIQRKKRKLFQQHNFLRRAFNTIKESGKYNWLFVLDIDEFIDTYSKDLTEVLENFNNYNYVALKWKNYGASGHVTSPGNSVRNYTKECKILDKDIERHTDNKILYNLSLPNTEFLWHHLTKENVNWCASDLTKSLSSLSYDNIYIKHYITRSWEEYVWKITVRGMCSTDNRKLEDFFEYNPEFLDKKEEMINAIK